MKKPKIGQEMFIVFIGDSRRNDTRTPQPGIVTSIGSKYVHVQANDKWRKPITFHIDSGLQKTNYSPDYRLIESHQQWVDEQDHRTLSERARWVTADFNTRTISLEKLRAIVALIEQSYTP
jgi:hypothetical protein